MAVTNDELRQANKLFQLTEGNDLEPAAACAVASLIKAVNDETLNPESVVMLNITGGGIKKFQQENKIVMAKPIKVFAINEDPDNIKNEIKSLFEGQ